MFPTVDLPDPIPPVNPTQHGRSKPPDAEVGEDVDKAMLQYSDSMPEVAIFAPWPTSSPLRCSLLTSPTLDVMSRWSNAAMPTGTTLT